MIIATPSEIATALFQGQLQFDEIRGRLRDAGPESDAPEVTIGKPESWSIAELYREENKSIPATISLLLDEADFFLVQFACSFRPRPDTYIQRARFSVHLEACKREAPEPVAFDLHPMEVYEEVPRGVRVAIAPSLKFMATEAKIGSYEIQYTKLLPIITAAGALESKFSWDVESLNNKHPLRGSRFFHAVIKCPREGQGVKTTLGLVADVVVRGLVRRSRVQSGASPLSYVIRTD